VPIESQNDESDDDSEDEDDLIHFQRLGMAQVVVNRLINTALQIQANTASTRLHRGPRMIAPASQAISGNQLGLLNNDVARIIHRRWWQSHGSNSSSGPFRATRERLYAVTDVSGSIALLPSMAMLPSAGFWGIKSAPLPIAVDAVEPFVHDKRLSLVCKHNSRRYRRENPTNGSSSSSSNSSSSSSSAVVSSGEAQVADNNTLTFPGLLSAFSWIRDMGVIEAAQILRNIQWHHINFLSQTDIDEYFEIKGFNPATENSIGRTRGSKRKRGDSPVTYDTPQMHARITDHYLHNIVLGQYQQVGSCSDIVTACLSETDLIPRLSYLAQQPWAMTDQVGLLASNPANKQLCGLSADYHYMMKVHRPGPMFNGIAAAALKVLHQLMRPTQYAINTTVEDLMCERSRLKAR
jgi:hypothetical protein